MAGPVSTCSGAGGRRLLEHTYIHVACLPGHGTHIPHPRCITHIEVMPDVAQANACTCAYVLRALGMLRCVLLSLGSLMNDSLRTALCRHAGQVQVPPHAGTGTHIRGLPCADTTIHAKLAPHPPARVATHAHQRPHTPCAAWPGCGLTPPALRCLAARLASPHLDVVGGPNAHHVCHCVAQAR